jgi:hypothetical protein
MNDEFMQLTIFDSDNDHCQMMFQVYRSGDVEDKHEHEMMRDSVCQDDLN